MLIPVALSPHLPPADVPDLAVQIRVPPHRHRHILHVSNEGGLRRLRRRSDDAPANASLAAWKRRGRKQLNRIITRILCETLYSSGGGKSLSRFGNIPYILSFAAHTVQSERRKQCYSPTSVQNTYEMPLQTLRCRTRQQRRRSSGSDVKRWEAVFNFSRLPLSAGGACSREL